jgi:hypothetical protein
MPRTCFVIMPFSATTSCTEEEWTEIFDKVFKPAVEGAGLGYECRRSEATRGNVVGAIINDLNDSHVVIADLTDRNANVFYELGARHALANRSIILAQRREDIPFDLRAYASHVYDQKTEEGKQDLSRKLRELLEEIDVNPDRSDNPVSDFLEPEPQRIEETTPDVVFPEDSAHDQSLGGQGAEGAAPDRLARRLARERQGRGAQTVLRLTRSELRPLMKSSLAELNERDVPGSVTAEQVPGIAQEYISVIEDITNPVEEFALAAVEEGWADGIKVALRLAEEWISLGEQRPSGPSVRLAQGAPAILAWRLIVVSGGKALVDDEFEILDIVVNEPLEVESQNGRFSHRSIVQRRDLFYPEALLGHADRGIRFLSGVWGRQPHLHKFFDSEEEYQFGVAQFLMVAALAYYSSEDTEGQSQLYPGYRVMPQAKRAMSALCSRLSASQTHREGIARVIGKSSSSLLHVWSELVARANGARLGGGYFPHDGVRFPDPIDSDVSGW